MDIARRRRNFQQLAHGAGHSPIVGSWLSSGRSKPGPSWPCSASLPPSRPPLPPFPPPPRSLRTVSSGPVDEGHTHRSPHAGGHAVTVPAERPLCVTAEGGPMDGVRERASVRKMRGSLEGLAAAAAGAISHCVHAPEPLLARRRTPSTNEGKAQEISRLWAPRCCRLATVHSPSISRRPSPKSWTRPQVADGQHKGHVAGSKKLEGRLTCEQA